ncbi:MAG: glycerol-3-phosphate 1-O-acyltransferase PlsY, partial [Proteobacteria bacterium]|nr:glycerol-3-phosphate 1-O-acyltransferase PlsY [Pseudomonadota bacterium]
SGNIGATNVLRAGSKPLAALTLVLDAGKGAVPVLIAARYFGPDISVAVAAGAVVGHLFPVWLGFRGGKGVATALGVLLAIAWPVGVLSCLTWLAVAALFRFSSLASIVALAAGPLYAWWLADVQSAELADVQSAEFAAFLAVIVIARHHANIRRLIKGGEPKIELGRR